MHWYKTEMLTHKEQSLTTYALCCCLTWRSLVCSLLFFDCRWSMRCQMVSSRVCYMGIPVCIRKSLSILNNVLLCIPKQRFTWPYWLLHLRWIYFRQVIHRQYRVLICVEWNWRKNKQGKYGIWQRRTGGCQCRTMNINGCDGGVSRCAGQKTESEEKGRTLQSRRELEGIWRGCLIKMNKYL